MKYSHTCVAATIEKLSRAVPTLTILLLMVAPLASADDIYVQLDGIDGEPVANLRLSGPAPLLAVDWDWSMGRGVTPDTFSTGRTDSRVRIDTLNFTHHIDRSTPKLLEYCTTGRHIPNARLVVRKSGTYGDPFLIIEFKDVIISSISTAGDASANRPTEKVSLSFGAFNVIYNQTDKNGTAQRDFRFGWSIAENRPM